VGSLAFCRVNSTIMLFIRSGEVPGLGLALVTGTAIGVAATLSSAVTSWTLTNVRSTFLTCLRWIRHRQCALEVTEVVSQKVVAQEVTEPKMSEIEVAHSQDMVLQPQSAPGNVPPIAAPDPYSPEKRRNPLSWDDYFMALAFLSAQRSKDPNKQVGACIVSQADIILSIGYNGFPRGIPDENLPWAKMSNRSEPLDTKYPYVCHAEANAILNANTNKMSGQRIFVTMFPCNECAKLIIQAGIREVIYCEGKDPPFSRPQDRLCYEASRRMLRLAGIKVRQHRLRTAISISEGGALTTLADAAAQKDPVCVPCGEDMNIDYDIIDQ